MAKKTLKLTAKNKTFIFKLLLVLAALLLLSVLLPVIFPNATGNLATFIGYFVAIRNHFVDLWMIYTFIVVILLASLKK